MSDIAISEKASAADPEKPVADTDDDKFPPFPEPIDDDFDEGLSDEEKAHYKSKFSDLNSVTSFKLHCTACDRHLGCSAMNESRMRVHPMLKTLVCHTCFAFYNSGEFDKGEDGSELYCRWCGQGGQVYCCADCVHVFCAKCIKRNLGPNKIKDIENMDDWKCFKCHPKSLWDLRAVCWALLRYCEFKNKVVFQTEDPVLREKLGKASALDLTECCRNKGRRKVQVESIKKKEKDKERDKEVETIAKKIISKIPPTIQVKKFASVNLDDKVKNEKKTVKRSASPKAKNSVMIKPGIAISPCPITGPGPKRFKLPAPGMYSPIRFTEKKMPSVTTRLPKPRIITNQFNGFNSPNVYNTLTMNNMNNMSLNMGLTNDNINLSLDSLTQGLDFAAVQAMNNSSMNDNNDDLVCTPDFIMEPLCEVTEDNDDDVQCITPAPSLTKVRNSGPPPLVSRNSTHNPLPKNVIQMTESDVSVNALTGGLKFRVDPQTLSSNKMYRLPDGRIFAINSNPNMPGGYSATIVSQNPDGTPKVTPRSETFAAKLSAVPSTSSSKPTRNTRKPRPKRSVQQKTIPNKEKDRETEKNDRVSDLKVPVEWFRYNMIDAVDALEYSLSRLHKLKKETTSAHLRTRTPDEMKYLHRTLEQLLTTSSKRFTEIRDTLNKEMKMYISHKNNAGLTEDEEEEEDDDVEILPNTENDDPIFIDENSTDSVNGQEVDLTGAASSEHNGSTDRTDPEIITPDQENGTNNDTSNNPPDDCDPIASLDVSMPDADNTRKDDNEDSINAREELLNNKDDDKTCEETTDTSNGDAPRDTITEELNGDKTDDESADNDKTEDEETGNSDKDDEKPTEKDYNDADQTDASDEKDGTTDDKQNNDEGDKVESNKELLETKADFEHDKSQDADMSEEMIETLLKDDHLDETANMELSDLQEAEEILS